MEIKLIWVVWGICSLQFTNQSNYSTKLFPLSFLEKMIFGEGYPLSNTSLMSLFAADKAGINADQTPMNNEIASKNHSSFNQIQPEKLYLKSDLR